MILLLTRAVCFACRLQINYEECVIYHLNLTVIDTIECKFLMFVIRITNLSGFAGKAYLLNCAL